MKPTTYSNKKPLATLLLLLLFASPATAQQPSTPPPRYTIEDQDLSTGHATMERALEAAMHDSTSAELAGLRALKERGAAISDLLTVEHLPSGGVAAEVLVTFKQRALRYPVKFERTEIIASQQDGCTLAREDLSTRGGWRVSFAPSEAFTSAFLNVITSGALPPVDTSRESALEAWHAVARLPALPVVVTQKTIFTPYGKFAWSEMEDEIDPSSPSAEVQPPQALVKQTRRWTNEFLEGERGAAAVDLVMDGRASWQQLNRVVFGVSSMGLYRLSILLSEGEKGLRVLEASAPVFDVLKLEGGTPPLVLGYYPLRQGTPHGWRVSQGQSILKEPDTCDEEMSFCTDDVAAFYTRFEALAARMRSKKPENPSFATFATTRDVTLSEALLFWQHAGAALGLPSRRVFISYIKR